MTGVIQMSDREVTRLRVMIDLADDRLTVDAAAALTGLGRRQIYRLRQAFAAAGPAWKIVTRWYYWRAEGRCRS